MNKVSYLKLKQCPQCQGKGFHRDGDKLKCNHCEYEETEDDLVAKAVHQIMVELGSAVNEMINELGEPKDNFYIEQNNPSVNGKDSVWTSVKRKSNDESMIEIVYSESKVFIKLNYKQKIIEKALKEI